MDLIGNGKGEGCQKQSFGPRKTSAGSGVKQLLLCLADALHERKERNAVDSGRTRRTTCLKTEEVLIPAVVHLMFQLLTTHLQCATE